MILNRQTLQTQSEEAYETDKWKTLAGETASVNWGREKEVSKKWLPFLAVCLQDKVGR